jgi:hypothetical protein
MFAATFGFSSVPHLLTTAAERIGKGIYDQGNKQQKRQDWYCFFQLSDLLGNDWAAPEQTGQQPVISDSDRLEQRSRQLANRPRLHA